MRVAVDLVENQMNFDIRATSPVNDDQVLQTAELMIETIGQEDSVYLDMSLDDLVNLRDTLTAYLRGGSRGLSIHIPPTRY